MPEVRLVDMVDYPQIHYADISNGEIIEAALGGRPLPCGQYAFAVARDGLVYLARDPIGCNKLFFGYDGQGRLIVGNRVAKVWDCGVPLSAIASCPPGHVIEISPAGPRNVGGMDIFSVPVDAQFDESRFVAGTRSVLNHTFAWLARQFKDHRFVVCLSGGLDSSVIVSFAAAHLPQVTAISFTYLDTEDQQRQSRGAPVEGLASASDDFRCAAKVASTLDLPFLPAMRSRQAVESAIGPAVRLCQDWRDFNVHCATVNIFLAQDIRTAFPDDKVVVLTGDLMNEYVCDYKEESVDGSVYYKIPRIPSGKLRKYFVRGLDAGDREIGVFWAHGLILCQPFVVLADRYMRIPSEMIEKPEIKWSLSGPLLAPVVMPHVNRAKTRAQVGGKDLGTLGIYHRLGIGEGDLRRAWQEQFPTESPTQCDEFIQFGRYKSPRYGQTG